MKQHSLSKKLALKCRSRGSLEGDLLFSRLIPKVSSFSSEELSQLEELLAMEDRQIVTLLSDENYAGNCVFQMLKKCPQK